MEIENHKEEVPFEHYREIFEKTASEKMEQRLEMLMKDGAFEVKLLGTDYRITWPEYSVTPGENLPLPKQTFLLRYLLEGKPAPVSTNYLTFREMPWGELYIQPFTGRVLKRAAFTFGTRIDDFRRAAEKLGGIPLQHGDAGYEFEFLGNYHLQMLIWEGDDEFPPNAQLLYTDNFVDGFAAEDRVVAGDLLINALKGLM